MFSSLVNGSVCEDNIQPNVVCQIVTPSVSCVNPSYEVFANNGAKIESGLLAPYVNDVYYFNFSRDVGEYLVYLCDKTTGKFYVNYYNLSVFGESFNWLAIILVFVALSGICLWVSRVIKNPDLHILKVFLFYFGMINSFILVSLTLFISSGLSVSNFNRYFEVFVILCVILLLLFVFSYVIYLFKKMYDESGKV